MLQSRWARWMFVLVTMYVIGTAAAVTLLLMKQALLGQVVGAIFDALVALWLFVGAYQMWAVRKTRWVSAIGSTIIVTGIASRLYMAGQVRWAMVVISVWVMGAAFMLCVRVIHALPQIIAIAPITLILVVLYDMEFSNLWMLGCMALGAVMVGAYCALLKMNYRLGLGVTLVLILVAFGGQMVELSLGGFIPGWLGKAPGILSMMVGVALTAICILLPPVIQGLARITIDEAVRMKVPVVLTGMVMVLLPALAIFHDKNEKLQYHMQSYLSWSLIIISVIFSLVTILLACWVVTNDIKNKQIFMTATKPVGRFEYLMGRWLGIGLLNLTMMLITGAGIYVFHEVVKRSTAQGETPGRINKLNPDRANMYNEVLTARLSVSPRPPKGSNILTVLYQQRLEMLQRDDPEKWGAKVPGNENNTLSRENRVLIQTQALKTWHTVPALNERTFVFSGLERAKDYDKYVVLRFKPQTTRSPRDQNARLIIVVNNQWPYRRMVPLGQVSNLKIPVWTINNGSLNILIRNETVETTITLKNGRPVPVRIGHSISFDPGEGLAIMYRVDDFAPNFIRAMMLIWIQLLFVAMFGLMAGTFLGFPVAALLSIIVFLSAYLSSFLHISLQEYQLLDADDTTTANMIWASVITLWDRITTGEFFSAFRVVIRLIGQLFTLVTPAFGEFEPAPLLSEGKMIPWSLVSRAYQQLGLVWTGVCAGIAWFLFRKRELARITV